jgi:hypothetical protein
MTNPVQAHLHIDYPKIFEKLESIRNLENCPERAIEYNHLLDSLPRIFSLENLIDYHNFLAKEKYPELKENYEQLQAEHESLINKARDFLVQLKLFMK